MSVELKTPDRDPDVILPETSSKFQVKVWVKEDIIEINKYDELVLRRAKDMSTQDKYIHAGDWLKQKLDDPEYEQRQKDLILTYFAERDLLGEDGE